MDALTPLLTIAIPTWNRLPYLKELLPNLVEQCREFPDEIEILVSDNCSTDGSSEYLATFDFSYYRNNTNIGGDANFIKCVEWATGEYVWVYGDDDVLLPGSISKVMEILRKQKFDLVILIDTTYRTGFPKSMGFASYKALVDFIAPINPHYPLAHTLITCNIFKRNIYDADYATRLLKLTCYSQMYTIMKSIAEWGRVFVLIDPVIGLQTKRAEFGEAQPLLYFHQFEYLRHIGKTFDSPAVSRFAFKFLIQSIPRAGWQLLHSK